MLCVSARAVEVEVPVYPELDPDDNAFTFYEQATLLMPDEPAWGDMAGNEENYDLADMEIEVLDAADVLETFREGIDKECVMPGGGDFSTEFPYLGKFRSLVRLLTVEAWVRQENGETAEALDSYMDAMKLGQDVARNGVLIHKLVGIACESVAMARVRTSMPMVASDTEATDAFIERLAALEETEVSFSETLAVEYDWSRRTLEKLAEDPAEGDKLLEGTGFRASPFVITQALEELPVYYAQMIAVAKMDWWRWNHEDEVPEVTTRNSLIAMILPAVSKAIEKGTYHAATTRGTLLVVALERYFAEHGEYPNALDALVPDILAELPVDPFSGEDYRYEFVDLLEYKLYSVGANMIDDGGGDPMDADPDAPDLMYSMLR